MGLFDKKFCDICGDKVNLLTQKKLSDGQLCSECKHMLDFSVDTIKLLKVANTDEITKVTAEIYGTKTFLPENQKPFTKKIKKKLTLQRARNPEKRKTDGDFFTEKECPSCGVNFLPDENGCCSYCGYTLHEDSIKWKIKS